MVTMKILDLTAGNRAVWFNRAHPLATFVDVRPEVEPGIVADSRELPAEVGQGFSLVVFDPPHKNNAATGSMVRNYGHWTHAEIRALLEGAAREAWRVTVPDALMAFKWNDHGIKLSSALALLAPYWEPLFGHGVSHQQRATGTSWVMLLRVGCAPAQSVQATA
jgi:hypothetical protein